MRYALIVLDSIKSLVREIDGLLTNAPTADDDGYWRWANAAIRSAYEAVLETSRDTEADKVSATNVGLERERLAIRFEDLLQSCGIRDYDGMRLHWARVKAALEQS